MENYKMDDKNGLPRSPLGFLEIVSPSLILPFVVELFDTTCITLYFSNTLSKTPTKLCGFPKYNIFLNMSQPNNNTGTQKKPSL